VARIREQCEGAGEYAADDLGEHESARQHRRKTHAALVPAVMVVGVTVIFISRGLGVAMIVVSVITL
jgi:hypothetical protein